MKFIPCIVVLILITTSCAYSPSSTASDVKSWMDVDPGILNEKIEQAYKENLAWATKPELYVFNLFDFSETKHITFEYNANNTENPTSVDIRLVRDSFLDDSVRGDIQQVKLLKSKQGLWRVLSIRKAINCWRREDLTYSSAPCS